MHITLVGPAYPWRGGLPLLVTDLAHRLTAEGHAVRVQTWTRQGPARLLPTRRLATPEAAVFPTEPAPLSWRSPVDAWRVRHRRLLFFGKVRRYKGLDVLLHALAQVDDVHLTVVGEVYPDAGDVDALVERLGLRHRVALQPGYLAAARIPDLFASVDALVLPYRSATASQHVALAHRHRVPVVATRVGNFPDAVDDGVDGLLCAPDDAADLVRALRALYAPGCLEALRAAVRTADGEQVWKGYLATLLARTSARPPRLLR